MASRAVIRPNKGLYFDRPPLAIPAGGLKDGYNFRIQQGRLTNQNIGWTQFGTVITQSAVLHIETFTPRNGNSFLIVVDMENIYTYDASLDTLTFLNPRYAVGTASASGTAVTGVGTTWSTNVKAGDYISFGSASQNDPLATWFKIASVNSNTSITLEATAGTVAAGPYTIRTAFQSLASHPIITDVFFGDGDTGDDLWFMTNGVDAPITWNGSDPTVTIHTDLGFVCQSLGTYSNMMLYGGLSGAGTYDAPSSMTNSDAGLPLHAGNLGTGIAEQFKLYAGNGFVSAIRLLGDYVVFYGPEHVVLGQFVGGDTLFNFRQAISQLGPITGPINGVSIAAFGNYHEYIGTNGQFRFDGVTIQRVNDHVWQQTVKGFDLSRKGQYYVFIDPQIGEAIWSIPQGTDVPVASGMQPATDAFSEHYTEDVGQSPYTPYSKRFFPFSTVGLTFTDTTLTWATATMTWEEATFTWADAAGTTDFPQPLGGSVDGKLWALNNGISDPNGVLSSFVRFGRLPMVDGRQRGLLTRVYPFAEKLDASITTEVFVGNAGGTALTSVGTWNTDTHFPIEGHFVAVYRRGRYYETKFGSGTDVWILDGYDVDIREGGTR